jgi:hypothetical protein
LKRYIQKTLVLKVGIEKERDLEKFLKKHLHKASAQSVFTKHLENSPPNFISELHTEKDLVLKVSIEKERDQESSSKPLTLVLKWGETQKSS